MKKNILPFVVIGSLLCAMFSCKSKEISTDQCTKIVTEEMALKEINLKKGEIFCVKLPARMGTGYSWYVEKITPHIKNIGTPLQIPDEKRGPGSVDYQIFRFIGEQEGKTELIFAYKRIWEKNPPQKQLEIKLIIE